jgi:hypothetical protein
MGIYFSASITKAKSREIIVGFCSVQAMPHFQKVLHGGQEWAGA